MEGKDTYGVHPSVQESNPLQDENDELKSKDIQLNNGVAENRRSFFAEFKSSKITRFNVALSVSTSFAFSILGWSKGQIGPAFLDLLFISGINLEKGSVYLTLFFTGRVIGCVVAGAILSKVNKYLVLVVSICLNSGMFAVIPWCSLYEVMATAHMLHGISGGVISVAVTSMAVSIWGRTPRGRSYIHMHFAAFAIAGLLSPMVTAPFLIQTSTDVFINQSISTLDELTTIGYDIRMKPESTSINISNEFVNQSNISINPHQESKLYVAYSISAAIVICSAIPFLFFYKLDKRGSKGSESIKFNFIGNAPMYLKYLQLINMAILAILFMSTDVTVSGFLTVFCVKHLKWKKSTASLVTSVLFFANLLGRVCGIFIVRYLKPHAILILTVIICSVGFVVLSVSARVYFDVGIWIAICIAGLPIGIQWPTLLSWINETLVPVDGKMSGYLMVMAFTGVILSPLLFGYMMEKYSPIWFCYLSLGQSIIAGGNVFLVALYTRFVHRNVKNPSVN